MKNIFISTPARPASRSEAGEYYRHQPVDKWFNNPKGKAEYHERKFLVWGFILVFILVLAAPAAALAHNPRLVGQSKMVEILNPEISQAFYGQLDGQAQWFEFTIDKEFQLYVNILVPKIPEAKKNISVEVYFGERFIAWLDADNMKWTEFHEPFLNDDYWQGEAYQHLNEAGLYRFKVYNRDNQGKYVLVVGEQESLTQKEILKTLIFAPTIQRDFFGKSVFSILFSYTGLLIVGFLLVLAAFIFVAVKLVKKIIKKRRKNQSAA